MKIIANHAPEFLDLGEYHQGEYYQGFMNGDRTKFISFFVKEDEVEVPQERIDAGHGYTRLNVYLLVGVLYDDEWYIKEEQSMTFHPPDLEIGKQQYFNGLQGWNYFKENSTEYNPDFWKTKLFETVSYDTRKLGEALPAGQSSEGAEQEVHKVVVDVLKEELDQDIEELRVSISDEYLKPLMERLKEADPDGFTTYNWMYKKPVLIFPRDVSVVLNPVQMANAKEECMVRYFVIFPSQKEVYEWQYFKPKLRGSNHWHYGSYVIDQLKPLTKWSFGVRTHDDDNFWEKYVLKKEEGEYKYLKKID